MRVNDQIVNNTKKDYYIIEDLLGKGTFGQVVRCSKLGHNCQYAVKVIKSKQAYMIQAKTEVVLLTKINKAEDNSTSRIVKLLDFFVFKNHFCLVFELLELSLYDCLRSVNFSGFSFSYISSWSRQILEGMIVAEKLHIIHCDLKPENILLKGYIFLIDFQE